MKIKKRTQKNVMKQRKSKRAKYVYYSKRFNIWFAHVPFTKEEYAAGAVKVMLHYKNVVDPD